MQLPKKPLPVARGRAELLAVQALTLIAEDEARMRSFLAQPASNRRRARGRLFGRRAEAYTRQREFLVAFADSAGIDPAEIARARAALGRSADRERDLP